MTTKKNILFIGANGMYEISNYVNDYQNGIFIEALPDVFSILRNNLQNANDKYNTNYLPINCLVTDKSDKEYIFNVFNNQGASSSIYECNTSEWQWARVKKVNEIKLKSTTIERILKDQKWEDLRYDLVLDVQGAELDVLKGFNIDNFKNIDKITTEVSTREFYKNGVLFDDLNNFITNLGFKITAPPCGNHCDVVYVRI
jgi:FkbM family methyltransferase